MIWGQGHHIHCFKIAKYNVCKVKAERKKYRRKNLCYFSKPLKEKIHRNVIVIKGLNVLMPFGARHLMKMGKTGWVRTVVNLRAQTSSEMESRGLASVRCSQGGNLDPVSELLILVFF